jgi:hypothetical protein
MSLRKVVKFFLEQSPPLVATVRDWCKNHSLPIQILREPEFEEWQLPSYQTPQLVNRFEESRQYQTYQLYRVDIEGCEVRGLDGLIVLPDGTFTLEPVWWNKQHIQMSPQYKKRIQPAKTRVEGPVVSLLQQFSTSYFHWIHDSLGKLWLTQEAFPKEVRYLVPKGLSDDQLNLLNAFSIRPEQCIKVGPSDRILPERLIYISSVVSCGRYSREQTRWLADSLRRHFGLEDACGNERIFISREKANFRRVANQVEIEKHLRDLGFQFYILEDMSIKKQAELFANSSIIVGPHGAGFTNLYFSSQKTKVIEFFPQDDIRPHYWALSAALGIKYDCRTCETIPAQFGQSDLLLSSEDLSQLY